MTQLTTRIGLLVWIPQLYYGTTKWKCFFLTCDSVLFSCVTFSFKHNSRNHTSWRVCNESVAGENSGCSLKPLKRNPGDHRAFNGWNNHSLADRYRRKLAGGKQQCIRYRFISREPITQEPFHFTRWMNIHYLNRPVFLFAFAFFFLSLSLYSSFFCFLFLFTVFAFWKLYLIFLFCFASVFLYSSEHWTIC